MEYSIVIPAHNEALNIERFVASFIRNIPENIILTEIVLVENGSTDDTLQACYRLRRRFPKQIRVLAIARASYGEAIRHGMLQSRGTHLSILECDCLNADFVVDSIQLFQTQKARFIVASKRHPESIDRRPFKRRLLTAFYNYCLGLVFGYPGTDTHGLKSIETSCAKQLCDLAITSDEVFQTEIVLLAWRLGIEIHERPIHILETRQAPVAILKRVPSVLDTVRELKRSLGRFPEKAPPFGTNRPEFIRKLQSAAPISDIPPIAVSKLHVPEQDELQQNRSR
jgi:dolichyl-phosphate beta-glucosyltransferase